MHSPVLVFVFLPNKNRRSEHPKETAAAVSSSQYAPHPRARIHLGLSEAPCLRHLIFLSRTILSLSSPARPPNLTIPATLGGTGWHGAERVPERVRPQESPMFIGLGTTVRVWTPLRHPPAAPAVVGSTAPVAPRPACHYSPSLLADFLLPCRNSESLTPVKALAAPPPLSCQHD